MPITQIVTRQIKNLAVTTAKLADGAVSLIKLAVLTTKGDLLVFDTVHNRLGVGADGTVLTADAASSPGVKWSAPAIVAASFVFNETPSGTVNGTNPTFTLANTPLANSVRVYVNGLRQFLGSGNDYTISTNTVVFETGSIPTTGDTIVVDYLK